MTLPTAGFAFDVTARDGEARTTLTGSALTSWGRSGTVETWIERAMQQSACVRRISEPGWDNVASPQPANKPSKWTRR